MYAVANENIILDSKPFRKKFKLVSCSEAKAFMLLLYCDRYKQ